MKKTARKLYLAIASALVSTGCILVALTLAFDWWSEREIPNHNGSKTTITRGVFNKCIKNRTTRGNAARTQCIPWTLKNSNEASIDFNKAILCLVLSSIISAGISILISFMATFNRRPIFLYPVLTIESTSVLLGLAASILYAVTFIQEPWAPGLSYYLLLVGCVLITGACAVHWFIGDVKFYGKVWCVPPASTPDYRYHKTDDSILEVE